MKFLEDAPRFLFFTGKGGVGKTSVACATALTLARAGKRVLLVSTDPASNVGQVFGVTIGNTVTADPGVPGLFALEIDPEQAAEAYRERIIGPVADSCRRRSWPEIARASRVPAPPRSPPSTSSPTCSPATAPTASTTTSSSTPPRQATRSGCCSCPVRGPTSWRPARATRPASAPLSGLEKHKQVYAKAVQALTDPARTRLVLVSRAQTSSLSEIERTYLELNQIGIGGRLSSSSTASCRKRAGDEALARALRAREAAAIAAIPRPSPPSPRCPGSEAGQYGRRPGAESLFAATPPVPESLSGGAARRD